MKKKKIRKLLEGFYEEYRKCMPGWSIKPYEEIEADCEKVIKKYVNKLS